MELTFYWPPYGQKLTRYEKTCVSFDCSVWDCFRHEQLSRKVETGKLIACETIALHQRFRALTHIEYYKCIYGFLAQPTCGRVVYIPCYAFYKGNANSSLASILGMINHFGIFYIFHRIFSIFNLRLHLAIM